MPDTQSLLFSEDKKPSPEQLRLLKQIEVITRTIEIKPGGQPYMRSYDAVDKKSGEKIAYKDIESRKDDVLRTEKGRIIAPEEQRMEKEGWGRIVHAQSHEKPWSVDANVGIRTRGDDALDIKLVETMGEAWKMEQRSFGNVMPAGEMRRWEYQISRAGQDASKAENVLKVPVFSNFGSGLFADIGNKGSSYTSVNVTTKNFQPQKLLRNADDISINIPSPVSMGVATVILDRDPFEAFADKKGIRGGSITIPDGSLDLVSDGIRSSVVQLQGDDKCWGEVVYTRGVRAKDLEEQAKHNKGGLYEVNPLPQDGLTWKEASGDGKKLTFLNTLALDGEGIVPQGSSVVMSGNTGCGASMKLDGKDVKVPPHGYSSESKAAWYSPPVWLHGPGNKGTVDVSGLDGRVVISGGGTVKTSQAVPGTWWYADVILTGGSKTEKAVYTIEIPQFKEEKKHITLTGKPGGRKFGLERYPMPPYETIPLVYPDGETVQVGQTENDTISIRGTNIEVRVKEGDMVRTIYDSDKPELSQQSSLRKQGGAGVALAALATGEMADTVASRRQFMGTGFAAALSLLPGRAEKTTATPRDLQVKESAVHAPDPVSAPLEQLLPDIRRRGDMPSIALRQLPPARSQLAARG